ncbi:MAG: nucleotidyltransferase domain-containing protein [Candidatus Heimdallarchaeum endolithica]|uniref:Nucleotidyltransferase domain-containing protein n=1 Tax=Candidatus Heimdallarchaeum endolithica TaxID=2876572 RepID=A0A9Y1BR88_9ARCH|nr:MAG: nucleotidyltransferase domain-containing protein [Candidatus Heimdallarchaeum endolithica]
MILIDDLERLEMEKIFKEKQVLLALVFGSVARGDNSTISDIDIGLFFSPNTTKKERFDNILIISSKIQRILKKNEIDIVAINDAPSRLKFKIMTEGKIIYCEDMELFYNLKEKAMLEYFDFQYVEQQIIKDYLAE